MRATATADEEKWDFYHSLTRVLTKVPKNDVYCSWVISMPRLDPKGTIQEALGHMVLVILSKRGIFWQRS